MNFAIGAALKGAGAFIAKYWKAIIVVAILAALGYYYHKYAQEAERAAQLETVVVETKRALKVAQEQSEAQIEAMEKTFEAEKARETDLKETIRKIESNEQEITCPVPDVVLDALRM